MAKTDAAMFELLLTRGFQVEFLSHAKAILSLDFPDAVAELEAALSELSIPIEEIIGSGGVKPKARRGFEDHLLLLAGPKPSSQLKSG